MKKQIAGTIAAIAIAGGALVALGGTAEAAVSSAPDCTPVAAVATVPAVPEESHKEWQWAALVAKPTLHWEYKWTSSAKNPSTDRAHIWVKSFPGGNIFKPQITQTVVDVAAKAEVPGADAVTCVAGEPQPKVLPIPGKSNDQIYENPSEQYVAHITGHVTRGWSNGVAEITYVTDAGYEFVDGATTKVVTVTEIDQSNIAIPLPANPLTSPAVIDGFTPVNGEHYTMSALTDHRLLNGRVGLTVTADEGYAFAYGGGTLTSKVFALDASVALPANPLTGVTLSNVSTFAAPTTPGVVYGPFVNHISTTGRVGISATPAPGYVFKLADGSFSFATKNFAATPA